MKDLILFAGAPGVGKSTIGHILEKESDIVYINYTAIRQSFQDLSWKTNSKEELAAYQYLLTTLNNSYSHDKNIVLVDDLPMFRPNRILQTAELFRNHEVLVLSFVVTDDQILEKRILSDATPNRFNNPALAKKWNNELLRSKIVPYEKRIDTTYMTPQEVVSQIKKYLDE